MSNVRQAIIYSSASKYLLKAIGLVSIMIVARLLTPSEIGTFAIASAVVMIMSEFRLLGAGGYLVREQEIPMSKIRSALGLTILISWAVGASLFLAAPGIARFYDIPPLETIFRILSISFFIAPYIGIPTALLTRIYHFKALFFIKTAGSLSGLASTIGLILLGFSYYSLAWGLVTSIVVQFTLFGLFRPSNMPLLPSLRNLKPIARFGIYTSVANMLKKGIVTAPDMIIGKLGTTFQVAIFSRGIGFIEFLSQSLSMGIYPVALPYLSETRRSGGDVAQAYTRASALLGGLLWPVLAVAGIASLPTIRLFFGDQWDTAAPLATWLAIWAMLRTIHSLSNSVLNATGNEKSVITKEMILFAVYLSGVFIAFPYGLDAIAVAFVLGGLVDVVISSLFLSNLIGLRLPRFCLAWLPNVAVTLSCLSATLVISWFVSFENKNYLPAVLSILAILPFIWIGSLWLFRHPLFNELTGLISVVRSTEKK